MWPRCFCSVSVYIVRGSRPASPHPCTPPPKVTPSSRVCLFLFFRLGRIPVKRPLKSIRPSVRLYVKINLTLMKTDTLEFPGHIRVSVKIGRQCRAHHIKTHSDISRHMFIGATNFSDKICRELLLFHYYYYYYYYGSTALCWSSASFSVSWSYRQLDSLDGGSASRKASTYTQIKRTQYRHPCLEWDSNPRSQRSSEWRQFMF
jgi:hypothetical protein